MTIEALKDLAARAIWTVLQAFLAVFVVSDLSTLKSAIIAGAAAGVSVVKSFIGSQVGSNDEDVTFT